MAAGGFEDVSEVGGVLFLFGDVLDLIELLEHGGTGRDQKLHLLDFFVEVSASCCPLFCQSLLFHDLRDPDT